MGCFRRWTKSSISLGIEFGNESQVPVSGSDILPTIKDLAGKSNFKLNEIDGGSFKSILLDPSKLKVKRS